MYCKRLTGGLAQSCPSVLCRCKPASRRVLQRNRMLKTAATSDLKDVIEQGALIASVSAIVLTTATLVDTPVERKLRKLQRPQSDFDEGENFKWGVIGVISCIPLVNWTGWVFAAMESEVPSLYYSYAALYSLPLLLEGFDIGSFTVFMLILGGLHAQAQRLLVTEPETRIQLPSAASIVQPLLEALQSSLRRLPRAVEAARQLEEADRMELDLEDRREEDMEQLRRFDEQMRGQRKRQQHDKTKQ